MPPRSRVGNYTSCYSVLNGESLFVFDGGRGLAALAAAMRRQARFRGVRRAYVLVSHAHLDHWEGLKDADWFWDKGNGLEVHILGSREAIRAIRTAYSHPLYVDLKLLAAGTVHRVRYRVLRAGDSLRIAGWLLRTQPLHHYSGEGPSYRVLDTLGFRLTAPDGATLAYLSDHAPTRGTREVEQALLEGSHLALYDAHFPDIRHHAHGHGSQEHASRMARANPGVLVLAGHHGPVLSDLEIRSAFRRHRRANFALAREGATWRWDAARSTFVRGRA
jgi:phosphoribosyl 1,2-cyclic phosphodiesterase